MIRLARLLLAIAAVSRCGEATSDPPSQSTRCHWFQTCGVGVDGGTCGTCDDGDPCTVDTCLLGATCAHRRATDACDCAPACAAPVGHVSLVQTLAQGDGGITALDGVSDVAISGDGAQVYVAATLSKTISLFVDVGAGHVPAAVVEAGDVRRIALVDEGRWLAAAGDDGLRLFARDVVTGALHLVAQTSGAYDGLIAGGARLVATQNGRLIPIRFDTSGPNGSVPVVEAPVARPELSGVRHGQFDRSGTTLTVAGFDTGSVLVLDAKSLDTRSSVSSAAGLDHPDAVALSGDERALAVAGYCDSTLAVFDRTPEGALTFRFSRAPSGLSGGDCPAASGGGVFNYPTALARVAGPDNVEGLAVMTGQRDLFSFYLFRWDHDALVDTARLATDPPYFDAAKQDFVTAPEPPITAPDPYTFRGLGRLATGEASLAAAAAMTNAVGIVPRALTDELLAGVPASSAPAYLERGDGGAVGLACAVRVELSVDENDLYVAQRCAASLGVLAVDHDRGTLAPKQVVPLAAERGGTTASAVAPVGSDRVAVAITSMKAPAVAILARDAASGALTPVERIDLSDCGALRAFPVGIIGSPDGRDAYLADFVRNGPSCVHHVHRNGSGAFELMPPLVDDAVGGAESFAITRDGRHLYVASHVRKAVTALSRDGGSGALEVLDVATSDALRGAEFVTLGPGDETLYAASPVTESVVVFSRSTDSGKLTLLQTLTRSADLPLGNAAGLVVSPDGAFVYVAARSDDAVVVLQRSLDGRLTPFQVVTGGMDWPNALAITRDGRHVYAASVRSNSVSVLRVRGEADDGCLGVCP